jgi:hypothetical protein
VLSPLATAVLGPPRSARFEGRPTPAFTRALVSLALVVVLWLFHPSLPSPPRSFSAPLTIENTTPSDAAAVRRNGSGLSLVVRRNLIAACIPGWTRAIENLVCRFRLKRSNAAATSDRTRRRRERRFGARRPDPNGAGGSHVPDRGRPRLHALYPRSLWLWLRRYGRPHAHRAENPLVERDRRPGFRHNASWHQHDTVHYRTQS